VDSGDVAQTTRLVRDISFSRHLDISGSAKTDGRYGQE